MSFKIYNLYLNENGKILLHSDVKEQISTGVDFGEQIRKVKTHLCLRWLFRRKKLKGITLLSLAYI